MTYSQPPAQTLHHEVVAEITRCAIDRWRDGVAFGWRARRCAEAMLLALIARYAPERLDALKLATLEELSNQDIFKGGAKSLAPSRDFSAAVRGVREHGNTLAHVQIKRVSLDYNVEQLAGHFVQLVREYFALSKEKVPDDVERSLESIKDPRRALVPPRERELMDALSRASVAQPTARPQRDTTGRGLLVAGGAAFGVILGVILGGVLGMSYGSRESHMPPDPPPRTASLAMTDVPVTTLALVDAASLATDASAEVACPEGSVAVPPMHFRLRAVPVEDRRHWPALVRSPTSTERSVGGYCLQRRPLSRAEVARIDPSIPAAFPGCRRGSMRPEDLVGCLTHDEATRLCARWAPGGRLPTSLEWEAIVRASAETPSLQVEPWQGARVEPDFLEWTADPFPAPWLARGDARPGDWMTRGPIPPSPRHGDNPWNSWNHHADGRMHNVYTRCAITR